MKYILIFAVLFSMNFPNALFGQILECQKFKNGKFKIVTDQGTTIVTRKGKKQTEIMSAIEGSFTFNVKWIDNCTYTLTPTKATFKKFKDFPQNAFLTVKIIEVKENSYVNITSSNFADFKLEFEMIKID